jgi:hypothetical protein
MDSDSVNDSNGDSNGDSDNEEDITNMQAINTNVNKHGKPTIRCKERLEPQIKELYRIFQSQCVTEITNKRVLQRNRLIKSIANYLDFFEKVKDDIAFATGVAWRPMFYIYQISIMKISQKYFYNYFVKAANTSSNPHLGCVPINWTAEQHSVKPRVEYAVVGNEEREREREGGEGQGEGEGEEEIVVNGPVPPLNDVIVMVKYMYEDDMDYEIRLLKHMRNMFDECYEKYELVKRVKVEFIKI